MNLFSDLEAGETTHKNNAENEKEKKREQEEYEKKVGILVGLGQDSQELSGERAWWEKVPEARRKLELDEDPGNEVHQFIISTFPLLNPIFRS